MTNRKFIISTLEDPDGRIVAYAEGATFTRESLRRLAPGISEYVVWFKNDEYVLTCEVVTVYAIDDDAAREIIAHLYICPVDITQKITSWRAVPRVGGDETPTIVDRQFNASTGNSSLYA